jgi:membrane protein insertase Oxa1/YidC/SpoIIIJ
MGQSQRRIFAILMPAVMGFSLWRYAAGPSLYLAAGNVINLLFEFAINRSELGKEMHALAAKQSALGN